MKKKELVKSETFANVSKRGPPKGINYNKCDQQFNSKLYAEALRLRAKIDADFIAEITNTFKEAAVVQSNK